MMRLYVLFLLAFWQIPAIADIIFINQPTGASEVYNYNPTMVSGLSIVGGTGIVVDINGNPQSSGPACTGDNANPCNNCDGNFLVCNKRRIYDNLNLTFTFMSTSVPAANSSTLATPLITYQSSTGGNDLVLSHQATPSTVNSNNVPVSVSVPWVNICNAITGTSSGCNGSSSEISGTLSVQLGISASDTTSLNESEDDSITFTIKVVAPQSGFEVHRTANGCDSTGGICSYSLYKGDEKATIRDLLLVPSGLGTTYKYAYFYCSDVNHADITRDKECTPPVGIAGTNALQNDMIEGLTNGVQYYFASGIVDEGGNIGLYTLIDSPDYTVQPEEVVGLLDENSCFIATAAYGSPMEKHVKLLRSFRDRVLLQSSFGKLFVQTYYKLSPPLAKWIAQSSERRSVTRVLLAPVVFFAMAVMDYPLHFCLLLLCSVMGFFFWVRHRKEQHI